ncbi:protein TIPIN homolog [Uranotaenia lowii]|uniref:protein TIPIN homolog n=1 Tax=Uranotaenia lowii TaxID=190385 RepID=UPI0024791C01|nr:protein TIPIN homolog [Uranotaenia lowii]XP_055595850.1 protein TIPIN homolog [Uranotaenia lowii]XP_055595851.1 protein TIPIN homolog [Uranotaenia lowii]
MTDFDNLFGGNENDGEILSEDEPVEEEGENENLDANNDGNAAPIKVQQKKTVRNPRNTLNVQRLCGPRGVADLENYYKGFKFRGKGYEKEDLDAVLQRMQHWAHRLYPKYGLDDSLEQFERLGRKKQLQSYMNKYRMDMLEPQLMEDDQEDDGLVYESNAFNQPLDPLDSMLEEQIAISRAGASFNTSGIGNLTQSERNFDVLRDESIDCSPAPSRSNEESSKSLSDEVRAKIAANRLKALEIRKQKMESMASAGQSEKHPSSAENLTEL